MTKLLNLAIAALVCAGSVATAQTRNSNINDEISVLSADYLTNDEKMSAIEQDILKLTDRLLNEGNQEKHDDIQKTISSKQKELIALKREQEEEDKLKTKNRTIEIFQGDLTKSDLPLKTFKTDFDAETNQLTLVMRTENYDQATISVLSPGKEILHQELSTNTNGRHTMVVDLKNNNLNTICINIEANEKSTSKVVSL